MSLSRTIRPLEQATISSRVGRRSQPVTTVVFTVLVRGCRFETVSTTQRARDWAALVDQTRLALHFEGTRLQPADSLSTRPKCRSAKPGRTGGRIPGARVWLASLFSWHIRGVPLYQDKDPSQSVKRPDVELINPHRRRRSRPSAKRLRPPPSHPQGRRVLGVRPHQPLPCGYKILQRTSAGKGSRQGSGYLFADSAANLTSMFCPPRPAARRSA